MSSPEQPSSTPPSPVQAALQQTPELEPFLKGPRPNGEQKIYVAFSGGMDSSVLAHALRARSNVVLAHVNHGLHARADQWQAHCERAAKAYGLECISLVARVERGNVEARARKARYRTFGEIMAEGDLLLTAHHANDQAETRLWQLLTGRPPAGMPRRRALAKGTLLRPLLGLERAVLSDYAETHRLDVIADPMNEDHAFDRAFLRHQVLPLIEQRFPDAVHRMTILDAFNKDEAADPSRDAARRVRDWLEGALRTRRPSRHVVREILRQNVRSRGGRVQVCEAIAAWQHEGGWYLVRDGETNAGECRITVGMPLLKEAGMLRWHEQPLGFAPGRTLTMRPVQGGERLFIAERNLTKHVKELLSEARLPPWQRRHWPLLFDCDQLVAVPNMALARDQLVPQGLVPHWSDGSRVLSKIDRLG